MLMATPRLTIAGIIPVYNQRATLAEAVDSALNQTRPADEIIVVDDGSTDGSGDLVAQRYGDRVQLIRQKNGGAPVAFNTGIRASHSDLVSLLGADDGWMPDRIEKQGAFMEAHPSCMLSFTAAVLKDEVNNRVSVEGNVVDKETYLRRDFFQERLLPAGNGVMVRRAVFDDVGYFDESLRKCQDTDMWLRIMIKYGFEHIPEPLVWVRRGPHRTEPDMSKWFRYHELYFAKHRHTFGRGWRGQIVWRRGYSSVLRKEAIWYFQHNMGGKALAKVAKSVVVWPLFDSTVTFKRGLEWLLGPQVYSGAVATFRRLLRRPRREPADGNR